MSPTLNDFDNGDIRAVTLVTETYDDSAATLLSSQGGGSRTTDLNQTLVSALTNLGSGGPDDNEAQAGHLDEVTRLVDDDPLLPLGLSSARYRCIGNGVATPVAEWIAWRLADYFAELEP